MIIREERPEDFPDIYKLVKTAFETAKVADGDEQEFVNTLRERESYIPELALVAEEDRKLTGHVMLTETKVMSDDGDAVTVLMLAPLSVLKEYRSRGVGASLVRRVMEKAAAKGYKAVFLAGDPAYYSRFGFRPSVEYGIRNGNDVPDQFSLAAELVSGILEGIKGTVTLA